MLWVRGNRFYCPFCECSVFTRISDTVCKCNGCKEQFEGEPITDVGDRLVNYNGEDIKIKDVPSAFERAMLGYGHNPVYVHEERKVVPSYLEPYSFTPDTCNTDEVGTKWLGEDMLICSGCGLDVT